jgi:alpha-ketoglutarate-dependent taurine dioxygenase
MTVQTTAAQRPGDRHGSRLVFRRIDAPFGVEVHGIDWDNPGDDDLRLLTQNLRRHLLLILKPQRSPNHEQLDRFFERFGRLTINTIDGAFHYTTFSKQQGVEIHRREDGNYLTNTEKGLSELVWHNDHFHRPHLKLMSVIEAIDVEPAAVPTNFRDMYTVYEMLPRELKSLLDYKQYVGFDPRFPGPQDNPRLCDAMHLVFSPHPHSGRKSVFLNEFSHRIVGFSEDESKQLMKTLLEFATENAPRYDHRWTTGDICAFDNVGLQHRRDSMGPGITRVMRAYEGVAE